MPKSSQPVEIEWISGEPLSPEQELVIRQQVSKKLRSLRRFEAIGMGWLYRLRGRIRARFMLARMDDAEKQRAMADLDKHQLRERMKAAGFNG